jgi:putative addiction module component (TIGR02574 family)
MSHDNTCLMPGEMGRTQIPPAVGWKGTAGWEKFRVWEGTYFHSCENEIIGTGKIVDCEPYPGKYPADQKAMICLRCGYTELYYKETVTTPPGASASGLQACLDAYHHPSQGNTPGGPAREPTPPPGVEDEGDVAPLTKAQIAEIDRRIKEFDKDPSKAIPWEEVKKRIFAKVGFGGVPDIPKIPPPPSEKRIKELEHTIEVKNRVIALLTKDSIETHARLQEAPEPTVRQSPPANRSVPPFKVGDFVEVLGGLQGTVMMVSALYGDKEFLYKVGFPDGAEAWYSANNLWFCKGLSLKNTAPPSELIVKSSLKDTPHVNIPFPERIFELLMNSAGAMGVSVETFILFAVDDYIRRRRQ